MTSLIARRVGFYVNKVSFSPNTHESLHSEVGTFLLPKAVVPVLNAPEKWQDCLPPPSQGPIRYTNPAKIGKDTRKVDTAATVMCAAEESVKFSFASMLCWLKMREFTIRTVMLWVSTVNYLKGTNCSCWMFHWKQCCCNWMQMI